MRRITVPKTFCWIAAFVLLMCGLSLDAIAQGGPAPLPGPKTIATSFGGLSLGQYPNQQH